MRRQARQRGKALEERVAKQLQGIRYPGQAGDVIALGKDGELWILECKYRRGYLLDRKDQLGRWVEQAKGNVKRQGRGKWAIVLYGGKGTESLLILPLKWAQEIFLGPLPEDGQESLDSLSETTSPEAAGGGHDEVQDVS